MTTTGCLKHGLDSCIECHSATRPTPPLSGSVGDTQQPIKCIHTWPGKRIGSYCAECGAKEAPKRESSAPDIVSKIREALEAARNHAAFADARYSPDVQHKCNDALALLPQLESLLAKEPVSLVKCAKAATAALLEKLKSEGILQNTMRILEPSLLGQCGNYSETAANIAEKKARAVIEALEKELV